MIIFLSVFVGILLIDQGLKALLSDGSAYNTGIAFGWFAEAEWAVPLLVGLGIVLWWKSRPRLTSQATPSLIGEALLVGGALSNLIDRMVYGGIRDPLNLVFVPLRFNLADIAILAGLFLLFFRSRRR